jgi:hypothetical protein
VRSDTTGIAKAASSKANNLSKFVIDALKIYFRLLLRGDLCTQGKGEKACVVTSKLDVLVRTRCNRYKNHTIVGSRMEGRSVEFYLCSLTSRAQLPAF